MKALFVTGHERQAKLIHALIKTVKKEYGLGVKYDWTPYTLDPKNHPSIDHEDYVTKIRDAISDALATIVVVHSLTEGIQDIAWQVGIASGAMTPHVYVYIEERMTKSDREKLAEMDFINDPCVKGTYRNLRTMMQDVNKYVTSSSQYLLVDDDDELELSDGDIDADFDL